MAGIGSRLSPYQLFLIHPFTYIRSSLGMYSHISFNKDVFRDIAVSKVKHATSFFLQQDFVHNHQGFVVFVLYRLMCTGHRLFARNVALKCEAGKNQAIACDVVSYNRRQNCIYVICFSRYKRGTEKTWNHLRQACEIAEKIIEDRATVIPVMIPLHIFKKTNRIFMRKGPIHKSSRMTVL